MSYDLPTGEEAIKELKRELEILRESVPVNTFFLGQEQGHTALGGLSDVGGKIGGITSYHPQIETLGEGTNIGTNDIQVSSTTIIVDGTGNDLELQNIVGTQHDGQIVTLKPLEGKTLTLKTGGNIDVASDTEITDTQFTLLQYFKEADTDGKYLVINSSGSGGGFANPATESLDMDGNMITDVSLVGVSESGGTNIGSLSGEIDSGVSIGLLTFQSIRLQDVTKEIATFTDEDRDGINFKADLHMNTYNIDDIDSIKFGTGTSSNDTVGNSEYGIEADGGTSPIGLRYNVPSNKYHKFFINGTEMIRLTNSELKLQAVSLNMNTARITSCGDPASANDVVTKQYGDANYGGGGSDSDNHTWTGVHKFQNALTELGNGGSDVIKIIGEIQGVAPWEDMQNPDGSGQNNYDIPAGSAGLNVDTSLIMNTHNIYDIDQLVFARGTSSLTPTWEDDHIGIEFTQSSNGTDTGLGYHVDENLRHRFFVYGDEILTIDHDSVSAGEDSEFIGFHVSENTGAGSLGTMEIPYYYSQWGSENPSSSTLNSRFGSTSGCIGIYERNADIKFYTRNRYGGWSYKKIDNT